MFRKRDRESSESNSDQGQPCENLVPVVNALEMAGVLAHLEENAYFDSDCDSDTVEETEPSASLDSNINSYRKGLRLWKSNVDQEQVASIATSKFRK